MNEIKLPYDVKVQIAINHITHYIVQATNEREAKYHAKKCFINKYGSAKVLATTLILE